MSEQPTVDYHQAKRRARYSRNDWIAWTNRNGTISTAPASADSIKAAMLASGTQERFTMFERRTGASLLINWWMANNIRRQFLRGTR